MPPAVTANRSADRADSAPGEKPELHRVFRALEQERGAGRLWPGLSRLTFRGGFMFRGSTQGFTGCWISRLKEGAGISTVPISLETSNLLKRERFAKREDKTTQDLLSISSLTFILPGTLLKGKCPSISSSQGGFSR